MTSTTIRLMLADDHAVGQRRNADGVVAISVQQDEAYQVSERIDESEHHSRPPSLVLAYRLTKSPSDVQGSGSSPG